MTKAYAFYLCDGFQLLDLAGPMAALDSANRALKRDWHQISVISADGGFVQGDSAVGLRTQAATSVTADTIVVVGGRVDMMGIGSNVAAIRHVAREATIVASI